MIKKGICEQIINHTIEKYMNSLDGARFYFETAKVDREESAKILAHHAAGVIEDALRLLKDNGGELDAQIELVNHLVSLMASSLGSRAEDDWEITEQMVSKRGELLLSVSERQNDIVSLKDKPKLERPVTSLVYSSLFTGAVHEPSMFLELKKEILTADRIDMLVSFVKWSGLRLIYDELKDFTQRGQLRVITTSYMGATDLKAVEMLGELPNTNIKVSYDTKRTRLHAKAYVFNRDNNFTTAYIGSSNLSNSALSSGLEWNIKATAKDLPDVIKKINATFNAYWHDKEFRTFKLEEKETLAKALKAEKTIGADHTVFNFDINPYDYQQEILDKLNAERDVKGHYRNLIVAATGTGKTIISAFDYKKFCEKNCRKQNRLLFIAHREEILKQSIACFRGVLKDQNFGNLFVGSYRPERIDHLFMSVQTFNARDFTSITSPDFYDYIIVDEFHHAAATTYQSLLEYYQPKILLGLTATPERMDGKSVLHWFDQRIAAEIRLPEAIDRKLLSPFQYFGVTDNVDLNKLRWTRGGYDKLELHNVYTGNKLRAGLIVRSLRKYITDLDEVIGLGFCVSVDHANFMAEFFNINSIPSIAITSDSTRDLREEAKNLLVSGKTKFIFVVDLYNEGVDIPEVNTVLFLRPTESLTVFLQQLGRGLRLSNNKDCLTVLDFIGQAHKQYNFTEKLTALMTTTRRSIEREVKEGFLSLPRGSYIQLEKLAKEYILGNIRSSLSGKTGLISRIATFEEDTGKELSYQNFLEHYNIEPRTIYPSYTFSRLCALAGRRDDFTENLETIMTKALARLSAINSRRWIEYLLHILPSIENANEEMLSHSEKAMLLMLHYTVYQKTVSTTGFKNTMQSIAALKGCPVMFSELIDMLKFKYEKIDFVDRTIDLGFDCPLDLHCNYSRDQLLAAVGYYTQEKMPAMREGVKLLPNKNLDILLITLNKSDEDYSPSTMYDDYSINEDLFHWQSQSTTSEKSTTGQRYITHKRNGSKIALFVREFKSDKAGALPYTFLGLADYVTHTGSRPMSITWRLHNPIPANFIKKTNKLIVG